MLSTVKDWKFVFNNTCMTNFAKSHNNNIGVTTIPRLKALHHDGDDFVLKC